MKGLILKDLYTVKSFARYYGMVLAFMMIWAFFMKELSFIYIYSIMLGAMMILSVASQEEAVSFNRFALTMPVNTKMLVREKYFLFIITTGVGMIISFTINIIMILLPFQEFQMLIWRDVLPVLTVFVIGTSVELPVIFKLGVEKGRYVYIAVMLGMAAMIYAGVKICDYYDISLDVMETTSGALYGMIFVLICVISLVISYLISIRAIKNREW